jgi:hypothetical protein
MISKPSMFWGKEQRIQEINQGCSMYSLLQWRGIQIK